MLYQVHPMIHNTKGRVIGEHTSYNCDHNILVSFDDKLYGLRTLVATALYVDRIGQIT